MECHQEHRAEGGDTEAAHPYRPVRARRRRCRPTAGSGRADRRRLPPARAEAAGGLGLAALDARLAGETPQSLVGCKAVGNPTSRAIGRVVRDIKELAREYAVAVGDSELLRGIETAIAAAEASLAKRKATIAARQAVA